MSIFLKFFIYCGILRRWSFFPQIACLARIWVLKWMYLRILHSRRTLRRIILSRRSVCFLALFIYYSRLVFIQIKYLRIDIIWRNLAIHQLLTPVCCSCLLKSLPFKICPFIKLYPWFNCRFHTGQLFGQSFASGCKLWLLARTRIEFLGSVILRNILLKGLSVRIGIFRLRSASASLVLRGSRNGQGNASSCVSFHSAPVSLRGIFLVSITTQIFSHIVLIFHSVSLCL